MKTTDKLIAFAIIILSLSGIENSVNAQDWSALPGGCAGTDNNFYNGTASNDFPVARFATPGGSLTFNAFHDGIIAVHCNIDAPASAQGWNQLQVTYRDPDGLQGLQGKGTEYQAYVELVRVSKSTGVLSTIARFDSNLQCAGTSASCQGTNSVKTFAVPFSHTFDFKNYAYAVYGRLHRALATFSLRPALYQVRLQTPGLLPPVLENPKVVVTK
jgi:hypothetical protein